jgi:antitoxin (DNA-binding transcriptional repressor) of toxin-antitoxin stability system
MSRTVQIEQVYANFADIASSLQPGDEVTVLSADKPVARILPPEPFGKRPRRRQGGAGKGRLIILKENDDHLRDFEEYLR